MTQKTAQKTEQIASINLYKLSGYPGKYFIQYKHVQGKTRTKRCDNIESANKFLRILYAHTGYEFYHSNSTMQKYKPKSWKSYFFSAENNVESKKGEDLISCPANMWPMKRAHIRLFGYYPICNKQQRKGLRKHIVDSIQCNPIFDVTGKLILLSGAVFVVFSPVLYWAYKCDQKVNQEKIEQLDRLIDDKIRKTMQEYDTQKTINLMDTLDQKQR